MINIEYQLDKPGMMTREQYVKTNQESHHPSDVHVNGVPDKQMVSLQALIGLIQGFVERINRLPITAHFTVRILPDRAVSEGTVIVYWENDGVRFEELFHQIDGAAFMISRGCLGTFEITFGVEQTCDLSAP